MPANVIVRITDTLQYTPKAFAFPKTTTKKDIQQTIGDMIAIMKYQSKTPPFLSYGDTTKSVINKISHILQRSTAQSRLQILQLPPMLPQRQNKNILPPEIISPSAPDMRVEPEVQPTRVQTLASLTTLPPRVKPSDSPSLDPHSNPWIIKIAKNKRIPQTL